MKLREHERDLQQQRVAAARIWHAELIAERDELANQRASVLAELRAMNEGTSLSVTQVIHRQRHAEQLGKALVVAETAVVEATSQVKSNLNRLILADQAVRGLELLAERQLAEYQKSQAKIAIQEYDDFAMSQCRIAN